MDYSHVTCGNCGGIVRLLNDMTFQCQNCGEEIALRGCEYDILMVNNKTGWIFPILDKNKDIK